MENLDIELCSVFVLKPAKVLEDICIFKYQIMNGVYHNEILLIVIQHVLLGVKCEYHIQSIVPRYYRNRKLKTKTLFYLHYAKTLVAAMYLLVNRRKLTPQYNFASVNCNCIPQRNH